MTEYFKKYGDYTICKVWINKQLIFEVWQKECLGRFDSFDKAMEFLKKVRDSK